MLYLKTYLLLFQLHSFVLGFEHLKSFYASDEDFRAFYLTYHMRPKEDLFIQDGYLFKGTRLCIPLGGLHELLIWEARGGSLADHLEEKKTLIKLREHYYWLGMAKDV